MSSDFCTAFLIPDNTMNIALVGTGKTGKAIEALALAQEHTIIARFNSGNPLLHRGDASVFDNCDVVIDFSTPALALRHISYYCAQQLNVVMGTTGWYDELDEVTEMIGASDNAMLYAPNFSIGVVVLSQVLEKAAQLFDKLPEYDVSLHEAHHKYKLDSPSGTALHLAHILTDQIDRKTHITPDAQYEQIPATALHVSSQRVGHIFGQHTVTFDGPYDQITLAHHARNRDGFASGAIRAAEWIIGKKGLFTLEDMLNDWLEDV